MSLKNVTGWNIRRIRLQKGLTIHQVSSALPTQSFLSSEELIQVELRNRTIHDHELWAICQVLKVPVSELFEEGGE